MIAAICRLFTASPPSDSNRRPLPYHDSPPRLESRVARLIYRAFAPLWRYPTPLDHRRFTAIWDTCEPRCPNDRPSPEQIRAAFPDQNHALTERLRAAR